MFDKNVTSKKQSMPNPFIIIHELSMLIYELGILILASL